MIRLFPAVLVTGISLWAGVAAAGVLKGTVSHAKGKLNLVVYVENAKATAAPGKTAKFNQKNMKFIPHVLPIAVGTKVAFLNNDGFDHNVFSPDNEGFDLGTFPGGEERTRTFDQVGVYAQLCKLHPEMEGYIVVLPNRYFAKTGKNGSFTIKGIPNGKYELKVWGKKLKAPDKERKFSAEVSDGKGTVAIDFSAGE
ncbi:MAG: hypothetical protein HYY84_19605 [Deltaproteobacteria bacterium]|nr:hypothetical protein [Deltaproteobacteria bacterium]